MTHSDAIQSARGSASETSAASAASSASGPQAHARRAPPRDDEALLAADEALLAALAGARAKTLALVEHLDEEQLERVHSPIMSPLSWDLGHVAAYEDLWIAHRLGGRELLRPDLADCYDAFETPRAVRGDVDALGPADARAYMDQVHERTVELIRARGSGDGTICEMVVRHELQHSETMRQTLAIAGLLSAADLARAAEPLAPAASSDGSRGVCSGESSDWIDVAGGPFAMGAGPDGFAYDNELQRHSVDVPAFRIARQPVTSGSWMRFAEDSGYERRELWSAEGWAWKEQHDIRAHPSVAAADPRSPVCHVSWFEAEAFGRSQGARLPTEQEWEKAATLAAPGSSVAARSAFGPLGGVGRVWEWTQSHFGGYPGFVAHPYREYSEVFFGDRYRVLRGGSWATDPRVAGPRFRNWDLPERRQIFAGLRLAGEPA